MHDISTSIEIDAPPAQVWAVLTDFGHYADWNPFMNVAGRANEGAHLFVELHPPGKPTVHFNPRVTVVDRPHELRWEGNLFVPGLYDGEHRFTLDSLDGGERTRFTQAETFAGVLAGMINRYVGRATERGFEHMNEALKRRAEAIAEVESAEQ